MKFVGTLCIVAGLVVIYLLAYLGLAPDKALADLRTTWGL